MPISSLPSGLNSIVLSPAGRARGELDDSGVFAGVRLRTDARRVAPAGSLCLPPPEPTTPTTRIRAARTTIKAATTTAAAPSAAPPRHRRLPMPSVARRVAAGREPAGAEVADAGVADRAVAPGACA